MPASLVLIALAAAHAGTTVDVYTMGPGDDLFSRFGHAAICTTDEYTPKGRCFNYGTADFTTPVPLSYKVLRGEAEFWVSVTTVPRMLRTYEGYDRTVYRQRLPLDEPAAAALAAALAHDARPENRTYVYDHLTDNCATRVRDHVDAALGGQLRTDEPFPAPLRELVDARLGAAPMQAAADVFLGRRLDRQPTTWEAMFLPDVLRAELEHRIGAAPEVISTRQAPPIGGGDPALGRALAMATALGAGLAVGLGLMGAVRRDTRAPAVPAATLLGGVGLLLWALGLISTVPELRVNEALLWLWPTDALLAVLGGAARRRYLQVRLGALALLAGLAAAGVLVQPAAPAVLALAALLPAAIALRRAASPAPESPSP